MGSEFHIQQWVRATFFVGVCSLIGLESIVFVESDGLRVLFVDSEPVDGEVFNAVEEEGFADAAAPFCCVDEEHFYFAICDAHEVEDFPFFFSSHQLWNPFDGQGDIAFDFFDFIFSQKKNG